MSAPLPATDFASPALVRLRRYHARSVPAADRLPEFVTEGTRTLTGNAAHAWLLSSDRRVDPVGQLPGGGGCLRSHSARRWQQEPASTGPSQPSPGQLRLDLVAPWGMWDRNRQDVPCTPVDRSPRGGFRSGTPRVLKTR